MSDSSGSFSFGNIIFWIVMLNMFGFCDGDEDSNTKVEITVDDKPSITEQVKEKIGDIKPELEEVVEKAKKSFDTVKKDVKDQMTKEMNESMGNDENNTEKKFNENYDSVYGTNEDKW